MAKRKPGRPKKTDDDRPVVDRLLDAADEIFAERGIGAAGVDQIARRAGASKMSMYQYFDSKESLVERYLERNDEALRGWFKAHIDRDGLAGAVAAVRQFIEQPDFCGCRFIRAAAELRGPGDQAERADGAIAVIRRHKDGIRALLAGRARQDGLREPDLLADRLMLILEGALVRAAMTGDAGHAKVAADLAMQLVREARA